MTRDVEPQPGSLARLAANESGMCLACRNSRALSRGGTCERTSKNTRKRSILRAERGGVIRASPAASAQVLGTNAAPLLSRKFLCSGGRYCATSGKELRPPSKLFSVSPNLRDCTGCSLAFRTTSFPWVRVRRNVDLLNTCTNLA